MTLDGTDKMPAHDANALEVLAFAVDRSPYLNESQRRCVERLLQQVVEIYLKKDFV